jgi:hypothetical protein
LLQEHRNTHGGAEPTSGQWFQLRDKATLQAEVRTGLRSGRGGTVARSTRCEEDLGLEEVL